ncbi:MAG: hypothetical protein AAGU19_09240 [Prolixibacteraceae bacterium]
METYRIAAGSKALVFPCVTGSFYRGSLDRWCYVPPGHSYTSDKPAFLSSTQGFWLKNKLVHALLSARDHYDMKTTDAEAVVLNSFFMPKANRLKQIISATDTPVVLTVHPWDVIFPGISRLLRQAESAGPAALYLPGRLPLATLRRICMNSSLPVISATSPQFNEISSRVGAGAYALCLRGTHISKRLVRNLHESFPSIPVLASCGRSKRKMRKCVKSGIDAVIFEPCILSEPDLEKLFL